MILYSKECEFLGIGLEELSFLGFEDFEDFKNQHDDVADLFINRPGYIFKFKNFSWIDYSLHSGVPNQSVIIKQKNGNEIETAIRIKEVFLNNPIGKNVELLYSIEFKASQNNSVQMQNNSQFIQKTPIIKEEITNKTIIEKKETPIPEPKIKANLTTDFETDLSNVHKNETEIESLETNLATNFKIENKNEDESPKLKMKLDDDIESPKIDLTEDFKIDSIEKNTPQKLKINLDDDIESPKIDLTEDFKMNIIEENTPQKLKINLDDDMESPKIDLTEDFKINIIEENKPSEVKIDFDETNKDDLIENYKEDTINEEIPLNSLHVEENIEVDFDLEECIEKLGLDMLLAAEFITDFMETIDTNIPILIENIENDNEKDIKDSVYELKGIADSLNMIQLSTALIKIINATEKTSRKEALRKFQTLANKYKEELL